MKKSKFLEGFILRWSSLKKNVSFHRITCEKRTLIHHVIMRCCQFSNNFTPSRRIWLEKKLTNNQMEFHPFLSFLLPSGITTNFFISLSLSRSLFYSFHSPPPFFFSWRFLENKKKNKTCSFFFPFPRFFLFSKFSYLFSSQSASHHFVKTLSFLRSLFLFSTLFFWLAITNRCFFSTLVLSASTFTLT